MPQQQKISPVPGKIFINKVFGQKKRRRHQCQHARQFDPTRSLTEIAL